MKPILILLATAAVALAIESEKTVESTITVIEQDVIEATLAQSIELSVAKRHIIVDLASIPWFMRGNDYDKFVNILRDQAKDRDAAFRDALEDFIRKNRVETKLLFPKPLPKNTQLVTREAIQKIFTVGPDKKPSGWDIFYKHFPHAGGVITLSRPGIDSKHSIAILYLGQQSHYLAGAGQFYILKHDGKRWVFSDEVFGPSWVS